MRKVVHLSSVHARYDNRILLKQCVSLAKNGFDTYLVIADGKGHETFDGVKIIDVGSNNGLFDRMTRITDLVYKEALKLDAEVYQIHDPELIPKGKKLVKKGKKVIYDIHEDYVTSIGQKEYLPFFLRKLVAKVFDQYEKWASNYFTVFIAEKYYKERFPSATEILNYPILPKVRPNIELNKKAQSCDLIYSGNVTLVRGAITQALLLNSIEDIQITYIGYCCPQLAQKIYDHIPTALERFELIGEGNFVPFDRIIEKYQSQQWLAGLAIFPKTKHYEKKELTKFFEYMAYGIPVLCSDFDHWKGFVSKYNCGIAVDPDDSAEIKEKIKYLYDHPEVRDTMAKNAQNAVYEFFNWQNEERKLIQVYHKLIHDE
ncbi:MAG: glycosyltransferase [Cyclobacteriaceae bacterium]|nr:glycosyltransferase [Cyclobacteriaceae bacterium]MCH8515292.1 glycosyltransferase [Cyclobacteriaceae bacterium]